MKDFVWCVVIVSLSISLMVLARRDDWASWAVNRLPTIQLELKAQLRALHKALDKELGEGWTFERDRNGALFVRPPSNRKDEQKAG